MYSKEIPKEIEWIMKEDYSKKSKIGFFLYDVVGLDRSLTLGLEVFDGKKKIFTKFF